MLKFPRTIPLDPLPHRSFSTSGAPTETECMPGQIFYMTAGNKSAAGRRRAAVFPCEIS